MPRTCRPSPLPGPGGASPAPALAAPLLSANPGFCPSASSSGSRGAARRGVRPAEGHPATGTPCLAVAAVTPVPLLQQGAVWCSDRSRGGDVPPGLGRPPSCVSPVAPRRPFLARGLPPGWMAGPRAAPSTGGPCGQPPPVPSPGSSLATRDNARGEGPCPRTPPPFGCCPVRRAAAPGPRGRAGGWEAEAAVTGRAGRPRSSWLLRRCSRWPRRRRRQRARRRPSAQTVPPGRERGARSPPRAPSTWCRPL